jgi:hypothetical protein
VKTHVCALCNLPKLADDMGRAPRRTGGISSYCKVCVNECSKRSRRFHLSLPMYEARMRTASGLTLEAELQFLAYKMEIVRHQMSQRFSKGV